MPLTKKEATAIAGNFKKELLKYAVTPKTKKATPKRSSRSAFEQNQAATAVPGDSFADLIRASVKSGYLNQEEKAALLKKYESFSESKRAALQRSLKSDLMLHGVRFK